MIDKLSDIARHWQDQLAGSLIFSIVGIAIGLGQLMVSNERITFRLLLGRALSTGGLAMAAGIALIWEPNLSMVGQIGVAAGLASLGTSGLERIFQRAMEGKG
jgi:hypothetical protein